MLKDHILYFLTGCLVILTFWHIADTRANSIPQVKKEVEVEQSVKDFAILPINKNRSVSGIASFYDYDYPKGSGNWVTKNHNVAAMRDFKRGSIVKVCSKTDCVILKITDYGPEAWTGRVIDMGSLAFSRICSLRMGLCEVEAILIYGAKQ